MKLTRFERTILANQLSLMKALGVDIMDALGVDADRVDEKIEILRHGFEGLYPDVLDTVYAETVSKEQCDFVYDVLDMYGAIDAFRRDNPNDEAHQNYWASFRGFDGNIERGHMAFARFLIEKQDSGYPEQLPHKAKTDAPTLDTYARMVATWKSLVVKPRKLRITRDDVIAITVAAASPPKSEPSTPTPEGTSGALN